MAQKPNLPRPPRLSLVVFAVFTCRAQKLWRAEAACIAALNTDNRQTVKVH